MCRLPALRASHRYVSHTFADKKKVRALQAAELMSGSSLFHVLHFEDHMLRAVADTVLRGKFPLTHVARA